MDNVLRTSVGCRIQNLQALVRYFITFHPSIIEELDPLLRTSNLFTTDWYSFPLIKLQEHEKLLEDVVVVLFSKLCDNGKKTVLILNIVKINNFCGPDIVETLRSAGFNSWVVGTTGIDERCLSLDKPLLERMSFVSLILVGAYSITLDYNLCTKTFKLPYHASGPPEMERSILMNDYFYVPNHRTTDTVFKRYRSSVPLPREQTRHRRSFTAIPVGNLKHSRIRKARQVVRPEERETILFCAEAYDYPNSVVKEYGVQLFRKILDRFTNKTFILRPHPRYVNHPISLRIRESFGDEPRFIFDSNESSEDNMAFACTVITDGSVSGLTYCLAASRPAIFYNPSSHTRHFEPDVMGFNFEDGSLFRFTRTIDEVLDAMKDLVADPAKEFQEIAEYAKKAYAHPDDGLEYLLASIHAIVDNKKLPDWKTLELSEEEIGNESAGDYAGLIKNDLLFFHQFSPLLEKDLSVLENDYSVVNHLIDICCFVNQLTHLETITKNLKALVSGMEKYVCSATAIRMIDPLFEPVIERGSIDEIGNAIDVLQNAYKMILRDSSKSTDGSRLMEIFNASVAGTILSTVKNISTRTELPSIFAILQIVSRVPKGLISSVTMQNNNVCELSYSCRRCGVQQSMSINFLYSCDAACGSCGALNNIAPFEKALHVPGVFFAPLPIEGDVVLWGAGGFYFKLMQKFNELSSDRFLLVDGKESQRGLRICNKEVHSPDVVVQNNIKTVIITAISRKDEICAAVRWGYPSVENIFVPSIDITPDGIVPFLSPL